MPFGAESADEPASVVGVAVGVVVDLLGEHVDLLGEDVGVLDAAGTAARSEALGRAGGPLSSQTTSPAPRSTAESPFWTRFLRSLSDRGLVMSDAHAGPKA